MERSNLIVCIFIICLLVLTISPVVSAVSVSFVDKAYLENNDYVITDNEGTLVSNFTGSTTVTLNEGKSYSVMFRPNGIFDFSKESPGSFVSLDKSFEFFKQYLPGLVVLAGLCLVAATWRNR